MGVFIFSYLHFVTYCREWVLHVFKLRSERQETFGCGRIKVVLVNISGCMCGSFCRSPVNLPIPINDKAWFLDYGGTMAFRGGCLGPKQEVVVPHSIAQKSTNSQLPVSNFD